MKNITTKKIKTILTEAGVKPSVQRMSVLKYLLTENNHPSVDLIYLSLSDEIPTLSKTTVYNTLSLLVEKGLVNTIKIGETETLYDFKIKPHAHFKCLSCDDVFDIMIDSEILDIKKFGKHQISKVEINFKGICKTCQTVN